MAKQANGLKTPLINQLMSNSGLEEETYQIVHRDSTNSWDYCNQIKEQVRGYLISIVKIAKEGQEFLQASGRYNGEAMVLVDSIFTFINDAAEAWKANAKKHEGRVGFGLDAGEHAKIQGIGLEYIQIHEKFLLEVSYTAPRLQELVTETEYALKAQNAPQDPSTPMTVEQAEKAV